MSDLIRREDALKAAMRSRDLGELWDRLENISPVDAVELRHGRWEEQEYGVGDIVYICSECRAEWTLNDGNPAENNMNYCPECGAKMDGGEKDERIYNR